jgi:hypothetical protein
VRPDRSRLSSPRLSSPHSQSLGDSLMQPTNPRQRSETTPHFYFWRPPSRRHLQASCTRCIFTNLLLQVQNPPPLTFEPTRPPWRPRGSEAQSSNLATKIINPKEPRHHQTRSFRESLTPLHRLFPTTCRRRTESGPPSSPVYGNLSWTNRPVGQDESCSRLAASQAHNLFFVTTNQPQTAVRCRVLCGSFRTFLWILPNLPGLVIRCRLTVEINQGPADLSSPLGPPQALCKPLSRPPNASVAPLGNVVLSRFSTSAQLCLHSCFVPEPLS